MTIQNENPSFTSPERTNTVRLTIICRPKKRRKPNATTLIYRERVKAVAITLLHSERPYFASQVDHVHKDFMRRVEYAVHQAILSCVRSAEPSGRYLK